MKSRCKHRPTIITALNWSKVALSLITDKRIDAAKIRPSPRHRAGILIINILSTTVDRGVRHPGHWVLTGDDIVSLGTRKKWFGSELIRFIAKLDSCFSSCTFLFAGDLPIVAKVSTSQSSRSIIWMWSPLLKDPLILIPPRTFLFVVILTLSIDFLSSSLTSLIWTLSQVGLGLFSARGISFEDGQFGTSLKDSKYNGFGWFGWLHCGSLRWVGIIFSVGRLTCGWISLESRTCNLRA